MEGTRGAAAATLALLGLTASACTSSTHSSAEPTSRTFQESTAPTATQAAPSTSDPVLALVSTYVGTLDDLRSDPTRPLDDIYQVAVAPEATVEASEIGRLRAQDIRQTGRSELVTASFDGASPAGTAPTTMSPGSSTVLVNACIDVGRVDAVDNRGKSVLPQGRPRYLVDQLTVVNLHYPDAASWRVSGAGNRQAPSCSG